ncbi:MAG: hypothetical protein PHG66_06780 [Candidatus Colwellbacteria bacterium]|nr:hypothetical protein [Candidatus Colwellbacteria bacterium]
MKFERLVLQSLLWIMRFLVRFEYRRIGGDYILDYEAVDKYTGNCSLKKIEAEIGDYIKNELPRGKRS